MALFDFSFHVIDSHVNDIDVFVGGITETPRDDALVGPLFECLLGRQFRDIKCGDRYWYERRGVEGFRTGIHEHFSKEIPKSGFFFKEMRRV